MNYYLLVATVSLVLQLAILSLLLGGFELKRRKNFRLHGLVMLVALVAHITGILAIMVPSFVVALIPITLENPTSMIGLLAPVHAAAGTLVTVLGVWIMASWRLRQSTEYCMPKKKYMRATLVAWLITISLGVSLYLALNWTVLFGS